MDAVCAEEVLPMSMSRSLKAGQRRCHWYRAEAGEKTHNKRNETEISVQKGRHRSRTFPLNPMYYPKNGRAIARDGRGSREGSAPAARLRGTEFEFWLADNLGCDHATIIAQVSPKQLFYLQRRHASGHDLGEELSELAIKIAAIRLKESR